MNTPFSPDLLIFDLDGTIINTIEDLGASVDYALEALGYPKRSLTEYTCFVGNGTMKLVKRSLPDEVKENDDIVKKVHDLFSDYYKDHYADKSYIYPGINEALAELKRSGSRLCVVTNKPDNFAKALLEKFFPAGTFDLIVGAKDGVPKKPDPTAENAVIDAMKADKSRTFHIGDSDVDVFTAHNAGIRCVGCSWGFRSLSSLECAGADAIATSPYELVTVLKSFFECEKVI